MIDSRAIHITTDDLYIHFNFKVCSKYSTLLWFYLTILQIIQFDYITYVIFSTASNIFYLPELTISQYSFVLFIFWLINTFRVGLFIAEAARQVLAPLEIKLTWHFTKTLNPSNVLPWRQTWVLGERAILYKIPVILENMLDSRRTGLIQSGYSGSWTLQQITEQKRSCPTTAQA